MLSKIPFGLSGDARSAAKQEIAQSIRSTGSTEKPDPPRDLALQSGARKVIATWVGPSDPTGIVGFRVYSPTDTILVAEIRDPNCRKCEVTAPAGRTPQIVAVYVTSITQQARESSPIMATSKAISEDAAPTDPVPPVGWTENPNGGFAGGRVIVRSNTPVDQPADS